MLRRAFINTTKDGEFWGEMTKTGSTWTRSRIQFESVVDCYARPQHTLSIFENATGRKSGTGPNVKK